MSSTKTFAILAACAALGGCIQAPGHMQPNFGYAVRQDIVAQIADPDARYRRAENPGSNGERATNAVDRYLATGTEAPPSSTTFILNTTGQNVGTPASGGK